MNLKLGVCIPTYKRPDQLFACVRSVIDAARDAATPIFISDDSGDNTNLEVIATLKQTYPNIFLSKNVQNIGIDRNILKVIDECSCDYAWPIGEDDRMHPQAIERALSVIGANPTIPFIFANYSRVDNEVLRIISEKKISIEHDEKLESRIFFEEYLLTVGFIGACIINKDNWNTVDKGKYVGTFFAHVGAIFEYLQNKTIYLIADPLVLNRAENQETFTWSDEYFEVHAGFGRLLEYLRPVYGQESYSKAFEASKPILHTSIKTLCTLRAERRFDLSKYHNFIAPHERSVPYTALARFVANTPVSLLKTLKLFYSIKKKILPNRHGRELPYGDLTAPGGGSESLLSDRDTGLK